MLDVNHVEILPQLVVSTSCRHFEHCILLHICSQAREEYARRLIQRSVMDHQVLGAESRMHACRSSMPWWIRDALNCLAQSSPDGPTFNKISHILSLNAILRTCKPTCCLRMYAGFEEQPIFSLETWHPFFPSSWSPSLTSFCILGWKDDFKWYHRHSEGRSHHFRAGKKAILIVVVKSELRREIKCI